jgi:nickel/cobalt exporter
MSRAISPLPAGQSFIAAILFFAALLLVGFSHAALAQQHPFAVGAREAGGSASGIAGWILAQQSAFYRGLTGAVRAAGKDGAAFWGLLGLSFAYGVFHAAGPGHGKAVIASYMLANERALNRGLVIAAAAALLQALVAVAIVSIGALVLGATAARLTQAANYIEIAAYAGIVLLGARLVWTKGRALFAARALFAGAPSPGGLVYAPSGAAPSARRPRFAAEACDADHVHGPTCGHVHAPDPALLGDAFSWRDAALAIVTAGARPCSGAILVLVFALAQGIFAAGIAAAFAMSAGTAITTGALAALAVFAKSLAQRFAGAETRALKIVRGLEFAAALAVLLLGLGLLTGALGGAGGA